MTLRQHLVNLYGRRIYQLTVTLKFVKCKLAKVANQVVFLRRCKVNELIPKGLRLAKHSGSERTQRILREAEKNILVDHINTLKKKRAEEIRKRTEIIRSLKSTLTSEDMSTVLRVTDKSAKRTFFNVKKEHIKKFDQLYDDSRRQSAEEKYHITKSPVENLSGKPLSDCETKILEKGLGFASAPKAVPVKEIISAVEAGLSKETNIELTNATRSKVSSLLARAKTKPVQDNMTAQERRALNELQRRADIKIIPSDKGNRVVVMSTEEYNAKVNALLEDPAYKKVQNDPTPRKEKALRMEIDSLKKNGDISNELAKKLRPSHTTAPRLYCLPKTHKPDVPVRPITSMVDSPAYEVASYLTRVIGPVVGQSEYTMPNSSGFVDQVRQIEMSRTDIMVSFDVVSLFTKVPMAEAVDVVCQKLSDDETLADRTELSVVSIRRLIMACLECRYFIFQGQYI